MVFKDMAWIISPAGKVGRVSCTRSLSPSLSIKVRQENIRQGKRPRRAGQVVRTRKHSVAEARKEKQVPDTGLYQDQV